MIQGLKGVEDPLGMCVGFYVLHSRKNSLELKRLDGICNERGTNGLQMTDKLREPPCEWSKGGAKEV